VANRCYRFITSRVAARRTETVDAAVLARLGEILTPSLADEVVVAVRELVAPYQIHPRGASMRSWRSLIGRSET